MSGDENNDWMNSAPVRGDSSGGFPSAGEGINVRPDGVKRFSTQALEESQHFTTGFMNGVMPLTQASARIGSSFTEAAQFSARHKQALEKTNMLQEDVSIGVSALGFGAMTIAINYINGDATSAATMSDVESAFQARGNGLREMMEPNGQGPSAGNNGGGNVTRLPDPEPADDSTPTRNVNDPGSWQTIDLGDDATYTVPGAPDCLDLEMMDRDDIESVESTVRDDLAHEEYEVAPYDPDDYR